MTIWRVTHALQDVDGLARDQYVNTWHILDAGPTSPIDFAAATAAFVAFYTALAPFMAGAVSSTLGTIKYYDVAGLGSHLPPAHQAATGYTVTTTAKPLPFEVALCVTLKADLQPAPVKRQSTTGRVYLGPLNVNALAAAGVQQDSRPDGAFIATMADAVEDLQGGLITAHCGLGILSMVQRKWYGCTKAHIDNAWDTQRSRGARPTSRQNRTIAIGVSQIEPF